MSTTPIAAAAAAAVADGASSSAEEMKQVVKEWIAIDQKMAILQRELAQLRTQKTQANKSLMEIMRSRHLDVLSVSSGNLYYKKQQKRQPVNAKLLRNVLREYFAEDESQYTQLTQLIEQRRAVKEIESIHMKSIPSAAAAPATPST